MTDWNANETTFGYTDDSKLRSVASADGSTVTYAYDDADLPSSGTFAPGDSSAPTVWNLTRKDSGRVSGAADGSTATGAYDYDPIGQLAVETVASATAGYDHDAAGNLTGLPDGTSLASDDASQLTSATPASGPATSFTYDALGERTSATVAGGASTTYGWDAAGGLTSVTPSSGVATTFGYDGDGLRSSTTVGAGTAQRFAYDTLTGANALILSDGTNEYLYGPGDLPVEQVALSGGATHYLHSDGLGDVRTVTDPSGQVTGSQSFTPFGVRASSTGTATPFGYRAQYRDASTGLVWLRARFYDPATARFLSVDPAVESTRAPYAYAGNDPLDNVDPSGLWCPLGHNADGGCRGAGVAAQAGAAYTAAIDSMLPTGVVRGWLGIDDAFECSEAYQVTYNFMHGPAYDSEGHRIEYAEVVPPEDPWAAGVGAGAEYGPPASTPVGQRGSPMKVTVGTNRPTTIDGVDYSGHAIDQMQGRGIPPSVVRNTIEHGTRSSGYGGNTKIYDPANRVTVIVNGAGRVVTVYG